ncbi:transcription factor TFIIIB component B [Vairimorpha necatrix]|uniref:Transcription factor TFIIIB component B n=1 Tax=Vairimorpha necatrix TaxID=6039 RepID=A0AAX4JFP5_9MICR
MDKKLIFYLNNSNFKNSYKPKKKPPQIRKSTTTSSDLLKLVNGEICLDDNEMFVNLNKSEDMEVIEDDELVTSNTYATKKRKNARWTKKETECFFEALSLCGLEFSLISGIFENKDRKMCKMKYIGEMKKNKKMIEKSLNKKEKFCPEKYKNLQSYIKK